MHLQALAESVSPDLSLNRKRACCVNYVFHFKTHDLLSIFFWSIENKHALDLLQIYSTFSAICDVYCHFNATSYKKSLLKDRKIVQRYQIITIPEKINSKL